MSNSFGEKFKVTVFGQSHSKMMGVVIDGIPAGIKINRKLIDEEINRRKPGGNKLSTSRKEEDTYTIVSGIVDDITCGTALCALISNNDTRSKDYSDLKFNPRPSHADYPAYVKYSGFNDIRGGGQFSGRLTAPLTVAGAIAKDMLISNNVFITSHIKSIYNVEDDNLNSTNCSIEELKNIRKKEFPVINDDKGQRMQIEILKAKEKMDSVGGVIEVAVFGLPVGVGEPLYDSVESRISAGVFSIPGARGIEFGTGFDAVKMFGSEHNDEYILKDNTVMTESNNHGGAVGGLTTGMPLVFRVAIKPTSSIGKAQNTVNLKNREKSMLEIKGRHDPCIVPRALPAIESICAISILDLMMLGDFYAIK